MRAIFVYKKRETITLDLPFVFFALQAYWLKTGPAGLKQTNQYPIGYLFFPEKSLLTLLQLRNSRLYYAASQLCGVVVVQNQLL